MCQSYESSGRGVKSSGLAEYSCWRGGGPRKHGNSRGVPAAPVIPVLRASREGNRAENGTEGIEGEGVGVTKCTLHGEVWGRGSG